MQYHRGSLNGLRESKAGAGVDSDLDERVSLVAQHQRESVNRLGGRISEQEEPIEELQEEITDLCEENEQLRTTLAEITEWIDQGLVQRFLGDD